MTLINKAAINERRKFFEMVAKAGISTSILRASPLVAGLMTSRYASADTATTNKRVIFSFFPGGIIPGTWMPSGVGNMNQATKALAPVASMCSFYEVDMGGGGHGGAHYALGGKVSNTSVDMLLAATTLGSTSSYSHYALGIEARKADGNGTDLIGRYNGDPVKPKDDPALAYTDLFSAPPAPGEALKAYAKQKTAMDTNLAAINAIKSKLGQDELARLEVHAASLAKIDARLKAATVVTPPAGCSSPTLPTNSAGISDAFTKKMKLQIDIAVAAFQCGLTNIITLQMSDTQCDWVYNGSFSSGQHEAVHGRGAGDNIEIVNYQSSMAAYLIDRLAKTNDAVTGAPLINSTVYLQTCDFGNGAGHVTSGAPSILATKMPGFTTGTTGGGGSNLALLSKVASGLGYPEVAAKFAG